MYYVVGSGPASIAAVAALVKRGIKVTIIDPGKTLEPERQAVLDRLGRQDADQWSEADLQAVRGDHSETHGKIASKLNYGSDYPYTDLGEALQEDREHSPFNYSMARGGLSTVWGAALAPYCSKDIAGWPITVPDLEPHYRAVLDFVPSTGEVDELEKFLPTCTDKLDPLKPSRQFQKFFQSMRRNKEQLENTGIYFGSARVAIAASGDSKRKACNYCGLCLYGCPYSLIYSTATTLEDLLKGGMVTYVDGHVVEKLVQTGPTVAIHANRVSDGAEVVFEAERVFVGAGVLPTAYIMLNSLGALNKPIEIVDSQYFIYPFFQFSKTAEVEKEKAYATSQVFLEIDDPAVSKNLIHMEVYGYSDFVRNAMFETPLRFLLGNKWVAKQFFGRLFILQCFMHSDDSARLVAELVPGTNGAKPKLRVIPKSRFWSVWTSVKAGIKLALNAFRLGGILAVPGLQFAGAGRSYHSGGTFPMSKNPDGFQTDKLGRINGMDRVHIVDASIFPSIPATTITLSVMANSHRIATEASEL